MRILENNDIIEIRCPGCISLLGVEKEDITDVFGHGTYIHCIACGKRIDLSSSDIPKRWWPDVYSDYDD